MILNSKKIKTLIKAFIVLLFFSNSSFSQQFILNNQESTLKVYGTSSLHDWHIDAESQSGKIVLKNSETGEVDKCEFTVIAESLKSGKNSMDKNTYKALNTGKYKTIIFYLVEVKEIVKQASGKFLLKSVGNLTISNFKKLIPIDFNMEVIDGKVTLSGEKTIKMTDFNIDPPKALFGTITTGDEITIKFKSIFK